MHKSLILQWFLSGAAFAAAPGFVNLDLVSSLGSTGGAQNKDIVATVKSGDELLLTELQIGSNKDSVLVAIDTGSEYLWVMDSDVTCESRPSKRGMAKRATDCKAGGTFGMSNSNTFQIDNDKGEFEVAYLSGEKTTGVWGSDDVSVGGVVVNGFAFGVATDTSSDIGVLGLTFPERSVHGHSLSKELMNQGVTQRNAYSVFLNQRHADGNIMFGAVDHAKYYDELQTVPILYDESFPEIKVNVLGIDVSMNGQTIPGDVGEMGYVLDTGSTRSRLPAEYAGFLENLLGGTYDNTWHAVSFDDCSKLNDMTFDFKFDGKTITVPAESLDYGEENGKCLLQMNFDDQGDKTLILGIDVLRSMYFVVDLHDREVSLAQARYTDAQDIEQFPPPDVNRTSVSRGKSFIEEASSANSISIDILLALAVLCAWVL